jgi:hypothetical protein
MRIKAKHKWMALTLLLPVSSVMAQTTVTFQNGFNGYTGTLDKIITATGQNQVVGSTVPSYFLDGQNGAANLDDAQALFHFDSMFGNGPGQVPMGATIIDAKLKLTTASFSSSAGTTGFWKAAGLLSPFDQNTEYATYAGARGAWWQDGHATKPVGSGGPDAAVDQTTSFDVTTLAQQWADGSLANNGVVVQAGFNGQTTDGWQFYTTGYFESRLRPALEVTYTTNPNAVVSEFVQGVNGYAGNSMVRVDSGAYGQPLPGIDANPVTPDPLGGPDIPDDISFDGSTITGGDFIDGPSWGAGNYETGILSSHDQFGLVKFTDVFGAGANQAPSDLPVAKAYMVISTHLSNGNAHSGGVFTVHPVLRDWDTTTPPLHSEFGDIAGLQQGDGDIGAELARAGNLVSGDQAWFDVTDYLEGVRTGNPIGGEDFGLAILARTSDGWQIGWNGDSDETLRPRLVVVSSPSSIVIPGLPGDFNDDGTVNLADYTVWRDNLGGNNPLGGNGDENGASASLVDAADYQLWRNHFGDVSSSGSNGGLAAGTVPEPSAIVLASLVFAGVALGYRRSR